MSSEKGPNVSQTIKSLLGGRSVKLPDNALGHQIGRMLAEIAVELQDRIDEAKSWRLRFEALRGEIKTLAAIIMARQTDKRIVITRKELDALPEDVEVNVETPEPGVRIYTLHTVVKEPKGDKSKVILNG
jgi:hypothetical protein